MFVNGFWIVVNDGREIVEWRGVVVGVGW